MWTLLFTHGYDQMKTVTLENKDFIRKLMRNLLNA